MSEYSTPTQFIDLAAQQNQIRSKLDAAISKVLDHGHYIMGPEVKMFEEDLSNYVGVKHSLSCANGTDALTLVLMAWGVGPGDAVFVPSFTYVASGETTAQLGAIPFFVDVQENTFNMDPDSFKQAIIDCKTLGLNPKVVVPVDLFGQPADIDLIDSIARENNIKVLIDAAQSFGATYKGKKVGSMGDATTTSFFPAKPLGCYGDGGAVFTNSDKDSELINSIRLHGKGSQKYDNVRIGINSRLDTIQAAILIEKLKIFPEEIISRNHLASLYTKSLKKYFITPELIEGTESVWAQYTLRSNKRDSIISDLKSKGLPSAIYYPIPLSQQKGYAHFPCPKTGLPISEKLSNEVFSIPMHPYLSDPDFVINLLIDSYSKFYS